MYLKQKLYQLKENNMIIQYGNEFIQKLGMGDQTAYVYQYIYDKN